MRKTQSLNKQIALFDRAIFNIIDLFWAAWQGISKHNLETIPYAKLKFNLKKAEGLISIWLEAETIWGSLGFPECKTSVRPIIIYFAHFGNFSLSKFCKSDLNVLNFSRKILPVDLHEFVKIIVEKHLHWQYSLKEQLLTNF